MHLTELSIHGFKSFAKRADLTFPNRITAIVGPNGSGKSNVTEALRFVLGEQSIKAMRGKRGEDLIWGGSEQVARANRAQAQIVLDNLDRSLPLDVDTIRIERLVHRDGQNEYRINGQTVRLKDVHELLAAGNVGPSGHHIISQGEADRVLSATPRERRAMIEEALGLKAFQYKKTDAERKLEKTRQNIQEVSLLRKELAPHLQYLERELKKHQEANDIRAALTVACREYLKREDVYLAHQSEQLKNRLRIVEQDLHSTEKLVRSIEAKVTTTTPQLSDNFEPLQQQVRAADVHRATLSQQLHTLIGQKQLLEKQLSHSTSEEQRMVPVASVTKRLDELEQVATDTQSISDIADVRGFMERILSIIRLFRESLGEQDNQSDSQEDEKQAQLTALGQAVQTKEREVAHAEQVHTELQDKLERARTEAQTASQEREAITRERYELRQARTELQSEQRMITQEISVLEREREAFKDELQEAVTLIGRDAAQYFNHQPVDTHGQPLSESELIDEDRSLQRDRKRALEKMKIRLETLGQGSSEELEREYKQTKERDDFLAREIADLESSVETLQSLISDLHAQIDTQFSSGMQKIGQEFQRFFTLMFGGGSATLRVVAPEPSDDVADDDALPSNVEPGVDISISLPNKRVQGLGMLSGGERALSSIALIFAMSQVHPPLFIVLDETDAALDEANSRRYGDLIEALSERSQLILVTHNRETMSRAGALYGVTMGSDGISKLLSVQFAEAVQTAK